MHIRGTRQSGEPIGAEADVPSTLRVGDTFVLSAEEEELQILGIERKIGPGGDELTVFTVIDQRRS